MSAKTRPDKHLYLAQLSSLYAQAVMCIEKNKRPPQQVHALITSLQYFKENRLLAAIPKPKTEHSTEDLLRLLSLKLSETHIDRKTLAYLKNAGVEYVGEIYVLDWGVTDLGKTAKLFLLSLELPEELDLKLVDWVPPYADKHFMWKMDQPLAVFLNEKIENCDRESLPRYLYRDYRLYLETEYTGQIFQRLNRYREDRFHFRNCFALALRRDAKFRQAMYCPRSWAPPKDPPK